MSIADEITRLQGGKANLKTSLNAKNDAEHQITDETIDEYYLFADSITGGGDTILDVGDENAYVSNSTLIFGKPYTELEYIESTGTQYIDTNILTSNNIKISLQGVNTFGYSGTPYNYGNSFFGGRTSSNANNFSYTSGQTNDFIGNGSNYIMLDQNHNPYTLSILYSNTSVTINCGNYNYINNNLSVVLSNFYNIYLFALNQTNTETNFGTYKLYKCKIYDNNILVRDFIPVKDENNVVCLYDKVSKTFFYNQGTGSFIAGPEV